MTLNVISWTLGVTRLNCLIYSLIGYFVSQSLGNVIFEAQKYTHSLAVRAQAHLLAVKRSSISYSRLREWLPLQIRACQLYVARLIPGYG